MAAQYFNMAHESIRNGDRSEAVKHYLTCMDLAGEENGQDRTYKAFVAYQCGVCLLKQFSLDGGAPEWFLKPQEQAAAQLRELWKTTLRLFRLSEERILRRILGKCSEGTFQISSRIDSCDDPGLSALSRMME